MRIHVIRPIGACRLDVEIDERSDKEALAKALFFTEPDACGLCGGSTIRWTQHKAKAERDQQTYTYIVRVCVECGAESQAGDYQSGGMFWKRWSKPTRTHRLTRCNSATQGLPPMPKCWSDSGHCINSGACNANGDCIHQPR